MAPITIHPETDALIIVDMQNDFCPNGALPVAGGHDIVPLINEHMSAFRIVIASQDWHPSDHFSFSTWPPHCIQNTPGAELHPLLNTSAITHIVRKAYRQEKDAYSAFEGTGLGGLLRNLGITRIFVVGLATDYCVKATTLSARKLGFQVYVLAHACRAVNVRPGDEEAAKGEMRSAGAFLLGTEDIRQ